MLYLHLNYTQYSFIGFRLCIAKNTVTVSLIIHILQAVTYMRFQAHSQSSEKRLSLLSRISVRPSFRIEQLVYLDGFSSNLTFEFDGSHLCIQQRGSIVTIFTYMSATVTSVPPLLVFPRSKMKAELLDSTPPGSIAARDRTGWFQKEGLTQWINHFSRFSKLSKKETGILTLDGQYSYMKNIKVID